MRILVAQLGARMHYAVPRIFHEAGLLERFFTDSYSGNKPLWRGTLRTIPRILRPRSVERWLGREEPRIPAEKVTSFEFFGLDYARQQRHAAGTAALARVFADFGRRFN